MKKKLNRHSALIFFTLIFLSSFSTLTSAQTLHFLYKKSIDTPKKVSTDTYGNLYLAIEDGVIRKYDPKGELLNTYSPAQPAEITLLEAWKTVNTFAFYQDFQQLTLFDRQLSKGETYYFSDFDFGFVTMAAPAADDNYWAFDQVSFSLKKLNLKTREVFLEVPLDLVVSEDFTLKHIREYQNLLYFNTSIGIKIFDLFGNLIKTLPYTEANQVNFYQNNLYFLGEGTINEINLYNSTTKTITIPEGDFRFVLMHEKTAVLFSDNEMAFYRLDHE
ncbi:hypothetical protein R9C00_27560 [Flammeovirgaceae bacterium SG7u.111]|nr:hypothetical protein [Flammeovirgaceae bacterium SG7u.132]WPO35458.1 hypothetical protein R9C00_27560 [Flammeovirgaceae bacterium SG7u.111]